VLYAPLFPAALREAMLDLVLEISGSRRAELAYGLFPGRVMETQLNFTEQLFNIVVEFYR
jgi:hypothetical protein